MCETARKRAYAYTLVQPRVNRGNQTNIDQIIAFFIGQKYSRNKYSLVIESFLRERETERKEKGQTRKENNRSERARTHIAFIFFLRRQTYAFTQTCAHEHVTNLYDQTETIDG